MRRQWADHWQTYRIYTPEGGLQRTEALQELLTVLWGRSLRSWWSRIREGQPWLSYEVRAESGNVQHLWGAPRPLGTFLRDSLTLYRPSDVVKVDLEPLPVAEHVAGVALRMKRPACYTLAERPIGAAIDRALRNLQPTETALIQFLLIPRHDAEWHQQAHEAFRRAASHGRNDTTGLADRVFDGVNEAILSMMGSAPASGGGARPQQRIDAVERHQLREAPAKLKDHGWEVVARVLTSAPAKPRAHSLIQAIVASFSLLDDSNQVEHQRFRAGSARRLWQVAQQRLPTGGPGSTWSCRELASVVDVPGPRPDDQTGPRILELRHMPPRGEILVGEGVYQGRRVPIELSRWSLYQHLLIQGKTGSGKGVIQLGMALAMAKAGLGFSIFFPLQADAQKLMGALPDECLDRVVFFEVGNPRWALPLNILKHDGSPEDQERVVEEALNLLIRLFGADAIQARSRMLLRAAMAGAAALGGHLGDAERVMLDDQYRAKAAARIPNEATRRYLAQWEPGSDRDAPLNKLAALTWAGPIAAMVAQPDALDWAGIIRTNKIVIASLNQETAGELACNLAAGGILNQMIRAVKSIPPAERMNLFHLALFDEFRIVADNNESLWQEGFTQLRQFRFGIGAAGQYPSQMPQRVWQSVAGSVANKIVLFEEGSEAETCAKLLGANVTGKDLAELPALQGYANILLAGVPGPDGRIPLTPSGPFTYFAPPLVRPVRDWAPAAEQSMAKWCRPRQRSGGSDGASGTSNLDVD
ncbi:MAG TPA: hypothetical protein VNT01_01230 [Symbiobacteriaceae bacterium]|nr:hypothetical protein [Symbiobacteriaceae bacterium]